MKILRYQDLPPLNGTLLTWTLCEELRLRGHHVDYGKPEYHPSLKYDWVWAYGVDSWPALEFARKIGAKFYIHLEGVAYWRIGYESAKQWGYDKELPKGEIEQWRKFYCSWMSAAFEADSCTVNGAKQINAIEWLFKKKLPNCYTMCCGTDARYALTLPEYNRQGYMITVSRIEPAKRVFLIAEALGILKKRGVNLPHWVIIGYGNLEQREKLTSVCKENAIAFWLHPCFGAEKWFWIKRAKLMLAGWMGIPPSEGIVCRTPVLSINDIDIVEQYDDTIFWAENNDPKDYADKIEFLLDPENQNEIETKNGYAFDRLMDINRHGRDELYANTQLRAASQHEKIWMK